jgi:hypothetical protein
MFDTVDSRNIAETWFEALSYTWGFKEDAFIEIQVMPLALLDRSRGFLEKPFDDDCSRRNERIRWLPIRKNVESALRHLRNERTSRTLWIDSICIDQTDMDELNVQVGKMAYIYGLAGRVIAWIGEKTPDSDLAIHTLRDLGDQLVYLKGHYWISSPQSTKPLWANPREKLPFNNKIVQAIKNFFASPYFERLWIWQEVILASTRAVVQCGQELIEWATLRRSIVRLFDQFSNFPNDLKFRYHHVLSLAVSGSDSSMFRLIRATSRQKCTDPRDKVYGILGIMDSTMQQQITPNYSHDVPRVYKDAFIAYTNTEKSLRLFGQCHLQTRKIKGPTWVPDWSIRPKKGTPKLSAYFSSLRMKTNASFPHPDLLKADGIYCGTVKRVSTQAIGHNLSIKDLDSLRPFSSEQGCSISSILIAERWFHVFAAVFCVDTTQDISTLSPTSMTIDMLRKTLEIHFDQTGGIPKILTSSDSDNLADVYLKHISGQAYGHRMITSTSGLTGLAPDGVRIGTQSHLIEFHTC